MNIFAQLTDNRLQLHDAKYSFGRATSIQLDRLLALDTIIEGT